MKLGWKLPVERLSATSLASAIQCPEAFRQKYLIKQDDKLFGARFIGIVDHSVHEAAFNYRLALGKDLTDDELQVTFAQEWERTIEREGDPDWGEDDASKSYDNALKGVMLYQRQVGRKMNPVGVEEWIEFTVPGVPVPVVGKLDVTLLDRVVDRKTSKNKVSSPKSKWRLQAKVYAYATELPVEYQVITKQVTPQIVTAAEAPDLLIQPSDRREVEEMIKQAALVLNDCFSRFGRDEPWPAWGFMHDWLCNYCRFGPRYEASCPAWK